MREILFKAKRLSDGKWVDGYYDYNIAEGSHIIHEVAHIPPSLNEPGGGFYSECHEVEPETVCQQTGLKDINGNKIFEGDLVELGLNGVHPIIWDDTQASFVCNAWCSVEVSGYKIMGNIHDHD